MELFLFVGIVSASALAVGVLIVVPGMIAYHLTRAVKNIWTTKSR